MANALSPLRKKISIALRVETVKKIDKRAALDNTTRAAVVEYYMTAALAKLALSPAEQEAVKAEIEANKKKNRRG